MQLTLEQRQLISDQIPYDRIQEYMEDVNWKWFEPGRVPDVPELKSNFQFQLEFINEPGIYLGCGFVMIVESNKLQINFTDMPTISDIIGSSTIFKLNVKVNPDDSLQFDEELKI